MFVFAHLGIGYQMVKPLTKGLPKIGVFLGALLPDLLDKPLYYGLSFVTGKHAAELGLISGTRTFGHTAFLLTLLTALAITQRSRTLAAVALGLGSHLVLDSWSDLFLIHSDNAVRSALLWPLTGWQFPIHPFLGIKEHSQTLWNPVIFYGELLGLGLLFWNILKSRKSKLSSFRGNQE